MAIPEPAPVTIPEVEPTEAIPLLLLLHVPPDVPSANDVVEPTHVVVTPVIVVVHRLLAGGGESPKLTLNMFSDLKYD